MILTHGLYPIPGYTVSGNGIRAWGLAMGLVHHDFDVVYSTPFDTVHPHTPPPEVTLAPYSDKANLHQLIAEHKPTVLIVGYWAYMHLLPADMDIPVVMDLLAPWLLEVDFQEGYDMEAIDYIECLSRADYFLCSTQRQKAFHIAWLFMSGLSCKDNLIDVIPISADPDLPIKPISSLVEKGPVFLYGGVLWPWRNPENWLSRLLNILVAENCGSLHVITGKYPLNKDSSSENLQLPQEPSYQRFIKQSDLLPYDEMEQYYLQADIGIELSARNCERELSFSFRVIEYLRCGLPVICNDFLEVAELIKSYDAGWVLDSNDENALEEVVKRIVSGQEDLSQKRANAQRLVKEKFNYYQTIEPLISFCNNPRQRQKNKHFLQSNITALQAQLDEKAADIAQFKAEREHLIETHNKTVNLLQNTQTVLSKDYEQAREQLTLWQGIAEERRLSTRFRRLGQHFSSVPHWLKQAFNRVYQGVALSYRAIVKRLLIPLLQRWGKENLAIITRNDVFPVDHGAAAKIFHTARVLSYDYDEVYLITLDRDKFYIFRQGDMHEELYPRLLHNLWYPNEDFLRKKLTAIGIPSEDTFLYFPKLDKNFKLRVLYVALQKRINVYQAEFPAFMDACSWAYRLFRGKRSIVEHNIEFQRISDTYQLDETAKNYLKEYEVKLCNLADYVITVSQNDTQGLIEAGVAKDKITMISHGVDLENFDAISTDSQEIRNRYGISENDIVLMFHGIYSYAPNGEAAKLIGDTVLPKLNAKGYYPKCLAVGKYPPEHSNHPDLIYTNVVEHVAPYTKTADIAIVPLQDGGGTRMKILEYFAAAVPVIATPKGAEGIEVIPGTDILIEEDLDKFVDQIILLIENSEKRQQIGQAGRHFVEQLDWRKIGKRYVKLYHH